MTKIETTDALQAKAIEADALRACGRVGEAELIEADLRRANRELDREVQAAKLSKTDALARSIESLGAVEVAPGKWAFPARTRVRMPENSVTNELWHITDASGIISICVHAKTLSEINAVRMPAWWSPQQQTVIRVTRGEGDLGDSWRVREDDYRRFGAPHGSKCQRVTCDLTTGEEVEV